MTETFQSVILFYVALKNILLTDAGMTIARTLGARDLILTGTGSSARVRHTVVSPTVSAVCITLGADLDVLEATPEDPELFFPFDTTVPEQFGTQVQWDAALGKLSLTVTPNVLGPNETHLKRRYLAEVNFQRGTVLVRHENPPINEFEPSFKLTGGPYIKSGV